MAAGADRGPEPVPRSGGEVIDLATRGLPLVARQRRRIGASRIVTVAALAAALGAVSLWSLHSARERPRQAPRVAPAIAPPPLPAPTPLASAVASGPVVPPTGFATLPEAAVLAAPPDMAAEPAIGPRANPVLVFDAGEAAAAGASAAVPEAIGPIAASAALLTRGTLIPAVLETPIDTAAPGYVRALVSTEVRSSDGARVLVPRSSRLIGQYAGAARAGSLRAYVLWIRLVRPDGSAVALAAAVDTGASGASAAVLAAVAAAPLVSVVAPMGDEGGAVRVRPGEPLRVFAARDIDLAPAPGG